MATTPRRHGRETDTTKGAAADPHGYHPVGLALAKADAALWLLDELDAGECQVEPTQETAAWARQIVADALRAALSEAEREFRKSLSSEQALAQIAGGA